VLRALMREALTTHLDLSLQVTAACTVSFASCGESVLPLSATVLPFAFAAPMLAFAGVPIVLILNHGLPPFSPCLNANKATPVKEWPFRESQQDEMVGAGLSA
jgi:hypothetical protein